MHRNSYLYLNISVDNGSKTAEANRENVIRHLMKTIMTKYILILLTLLVIGCSTKTNKDSIYFVIAKPIADTGYSDMPPPLPLMFYGIHNFLLVDSSRVFYHDSHIFRKCGTGIDFSKPPRLFLTSDSITEINIADLQNFLVKQIPDSTYHNKKFFGTIASQIDTIRNPAFKIIADYFESKSIKYYNVRLLTEEENNVINSKLNKTPYDPFSATFKNGFDSDYSILSDTLQKRK